MLGMSMGSPATSQSVFSTALLDMTPLSTAQSRFLLSPLTCTAQVKSALGCNVLSRSTQLSVDVPKESGPMVNMYCPNGFA